MTTSVARVYRFHAIHHVEGLPEPWCEPHRHAYRVEVVCESAGKVDVVVDTDVLDRTWAALHRAVEGSDLNETTPTSTTVEALAAYFLTLFRSQCEFVRQVTVWEDEERWGRVRS